MRELDPLEISPKELTQIIEEEFGFFNNDFKVINRLNRTNSLLGIYKR